MSTQTNGRIRKSLAEQIDRLDGVIDALGDGLNEAIASAVKRAVGDAVRQAIQGIVAEILGNPDLLARLREAVVSPTQVPAEPPATPVPAQASPVSAAPRVGLVGRVRTWMGGLLKSIGQLWAGLCRRVGEVGSSIAEWLVAVWCMVVLGWQLVRPFYVRLLLAGGAGVVVGAAVYFAGPHVAAGVGWLAGFLAALLVQVGVAFRRLLTTGQITGRV